MFAGVLAGVTWAVETIVLGIALAMSPFVSTEQAIVLAPFVSTFLHDLFSAVFSWIYNAIRGNLPAFFKALKDYCDTYENRHFKTDDVMLDPNKFNPKNEKAPDTPEPEVCIFRGSAIKLYIKDHPNVSMQVKIKTLNDELLDNLNYYLSTTGKLYKKKKTEAIRRAFYSSFGAQKFKDSIFAFYDDFITKQKK